MLRPSGRGVLAFRSSGMLQAAAGLLACVSFAPSAQGLAANRDPSRLRPGLFLYAAPGMGDPRFAETVILLVEHGSEGSMRIVVNRPTKRLLHEALDALSEARGSTQRLYWGGPVQPEAMLALVRAPRADAKTKKVLNEVHLAREMDDVRAALARPDAGSSLRVYSGYAGWGAGQLRAEVLRGTWVLDRADADSVFARDPSILWPKVDLILNRLEAAMPVFRNNRRLAPSPPCKGGRPWTTSWWVSWTSCGPDSRRSVRRSSITAPTSSTWCWISSRTGMVATGADTRLVDQSERRTRAGCRRAARCAGT